MQMPVPNKLRKLELWKGLQSIGMATLVRVRDGKEPTETRFFISSLAVSMKQFAHAVRSHGGIENSCQPGLSIFFFLLPFVNSLPRMELICKDGKPEKEDSKAGRGAVWLARLNGVQEVGGSNPLAPTLQGLSGQQVSAGLFLPLRKFPKPFFRKAK